MPPTSRYLARVLAAAEQTVTAAQLARVLDVPLTNAANVLRYWERAGYLLPQFDRRSPFGSSRARARYSLTPRGKAALHETRYAPPPQPSGD